MEDFELSLNNAELAKLWSLGALDWKFDPVPIEIDNYKIIRLIGEGGMGIVYLAEQTEPIKRQVALKIVKPGMDSKQVINRFEAERQALALLDHPNIAHVFAAGTTKAGRPYFVMEYVEGAPLTEYCDKQKLNIEERLKLFLQACDAVQHAHQKGIIHRDLKPSNILIKTSDDKPLPVIIDFGVSKALDQSLTEQTLFTEQGQLIGTPEYMSPEQAEMANRDIDTRSDIYSLGVLLYELIAGMLPFNRRSLHQAGLAEIQRIIKEEEPPRPSSKLTSLGQKGRIIAQSRSIELSVLTRKLHKELEWIPLMAMRKERNRRYQTVGDLSDDIHNYIKGVPLMAGPESALYRIKKFVKRNRALVSAVVVILIVLTGGIVVSTFFAVEEARALKTALEAQDQAERLAYQSIIQFAWSKIKSGNFMDVQSMLQGTNKSLRGWEWGYLMGRCHLPDWSLQVGSQWIEALTTSNDGRYFLTGTGEANFTLWDAQTLNPVWKRSHLGTEWPGYSVFDPKGNFVIAISMDRFYVFGVSSGNLIYESEPIGFCSLAIHPKTPKLYAGTLDGRLMVFDTNTWKIEKSLILSEQRIWHLDTGSQGKLLASTSGLTSGREIFVQDTETFEILHKLKGRFNEGVRGLELLENLGILLVVEDTGAHVYSLQTASTDPTGWLDGHVRSVYSIDASADESKVITASRDGMVNIYSTENFHTNESFQIPSLYTVYHDSDVQQVACL
ncbi:MAG: protein kinase domain-containing protein, partial [Planctomycetota bacterium]